MKFLDPRFDGRDLMPIHIVSYDSFELGARDALAIIFKDMSTGQKYVETIDKPKYEVHVLKKEYWDKATFMNPWIEEDLCDRYVISFHNRNRELGKILGCAPEEVKYSPLIFGYDVRIEHYYWIQFLLEYGNDLPKKTSPGFLDIESDIIQADGFAAPGEAPTSCVTFIDAEKKEVYTIVLGKDNLPILAKSNPHYQEIEDIKKHFYDQVNHLKENLNSFTDECHKLFDESYGELTYHVMIVDEEIKLHQILWEIIHKSSIDYLLAWNAPYDVRNLIERPLVLGYEPESIICDPIFKYKSTFFEEDDNMIVHKRNHRAIISIVPLFLCQMWMYAGVRSAQGKIPSLKLTKIAQKELEDEKLNYEEEGNIKTFMYKNLWKYVLYNIKDVLLQLGIHRKTGDIDYIYDRCYDNAMLIPEAFVSTTMLTTSLRKFFKEEHFILGTNANRIMPPFDYKSLIADDVSSQQLKESSMSELEEDADDEFDYFEGSDKYDEEVPF